MTADTEESCYAVRTTVVASSDDNLLTARSLIFPLRYLILLLSYMKTEDGILLFLWSSGLGQKVFWALHDSNYLY